METLDNRSDWISDAKKAGVTRRGKRFYTSTFDFEPNEFVLDLGPGESKFRPENSIGIDFIFSTQRPRAGVNAAGVFQALPFADGSFDRAVASYSLFWLRGVSV